MDAVPYLEPCFATLRHRSEHKAFDSYPDAQAVAYQIRESEYMRILATEGGHGYNDLGLYSSEMINVSAFDGTQIKGFALLGGYCRTSVDISMKNKPSKRYRDIVIEGAKKSGLRPEYIKFLEQFDAYSPPQDRWGRLAKYLVLLLVLPSLLSMLVGVPFLLSLGFERPPYYYAWAMSNYSRLVLGFAYPALLMAFGPGMY
ncbi:hypothetical protein SARC_06183 [Sphaeroforma arctica JP610]|uniref:Uncharacterized protein n=1 Tax=Sphaeroforma arctica JP610 TaxID=667725 RepID=A0A0L0FXC5_9EUKA|nr:hypothetical protein SARC_06183 [Sphaeroforma arctica JP610]KNC81495.1 hypothetical protein SARC_06183 [Sphaeroforma arctica JP610]|eukprot:XP_014155397.1 hypothetical protein SARC_06183 [Sphaeroforma arctica JP610]